MEVERRKLGESAQSSPTPNPFVSVKILECPSLRESGDCFDELNEERIAGLGRWLRGGVLLSEADCGWEHIFNSLYTTHNDRVEFR